MRTLEADFLRSGARRAVWNGRDDRGRAVPSGVYFVRLVADGGVWTRKVMLLR